MIRPYHIASALALILSVGPAAARPSVGQVPADADIAACNEEAPKTVKAGSASPTTGDFTRANNVRANATTSTLMHGQGEVIESSDPQIHGMNAEGARDAAYQAAYRSCMRRKGF